MNHLALTVALMALSTTPAAAAQMFPPEQHPMVSEAAVVIRYANARCPEFGMSLSYGGNMFNELVKQAQGDDRDLMKMIHKVGDRERPRLQELGYPLYCVDAQRRYPGMFETQ